MNVSQFSRTLFVSACACLVLAACQSTQPDASTAANSQNGGRLTVHRAPDVATGLVLMIDGANATDIRVGSTYDGYLSPGQHVVSVVPAPNEDNQAPASVTLTVVKGETYSFTAVRRGGLVALVKD